MTKLERIKERLKRTTKFPWRIERPHPSRRDGPLDSYLIYGDSWYVGEVFHLEEDAQLIANAPQDISHLIKAVEWQRTIIIDTCKELANHMEEKNARDLAIQYILRKLDVELNAILEGR